MSTGTGNATSYDLTVGVKVNMDDAIYMISPIDVPLLGGFGGDGAQLLSSFPVDEITYSWMDEDILTPRTNLAAAMTTGETVMTVTAGDQLKFQTGDIVRIRKAANNEEVRVTGYGTTADTLLVTRAFAASTAVNYTGTETVIGVGTGLAEGSDPGAAKFKGRNERTNVTQIFGPYKFGMSGTEQVVAKYGVSNEFAHQLMNRTREVGIAREQALIYGRRYNSTTDKIRTFGGILYYISTRIDATSTQLSVVNITTNMQANYNAGGVPDLIIANPASLGDLNDASNTSIIRTTLTDTMRGRKSVSYVTTEYGDVEIARNRWMHPFDAVAVTKAGIIRRPMRPWTVEKLAKTGDSDSVMMVCEEGLEVKGQVHMHAYSALAYSV